MAERQAGIEAVVREAAGPVHFEIVVCGSEGMADTQTAIGRYVDRQGLPDIFMGGNDQMAIAVLTWALDRHLSVPKDLRVTGFNGFDFAGYVRPAPHHRFLACLRDGQGGRDAPVAAAGAGRLRRAASASRRQPPDGRFRLTWR